MNNLKRAAECQGDNSNVERYPNRLSDVSAASGGSHTPASEVKPLHKRSRLEPSRANDDGNALEPPSPTSDSSPIVSLAKLLDVRSISTHSQMNARFNEIASLLLWECHLILSSTAPSDSSVSGSNNERDVVLPDEKEEYEAVYELLEVEFYLKKLDCHDDPFTHGAEEQSSSGKW